MSDTRLPVEHRPIRLDVLDALEPGYITEPTAQIGLWPHELDALVAVAHAAWGYRLKTGTVWAKPLDQAFAAFDRESFDFDLWQAEAGPLDEEPLPDSPDPLLRPRDWRFIARRHPGTEKPWIVTGGPGQAQIGHVRDCKSMLGARFGAWWRNARR